MNSWISFRSLIFFLKFKEKHLKSICFRFAHSVVFDNEARSGRFTLQFFFSGEQLSLPVANFISFCWSNIFFWIYCLPLISKICELSLNFHWRDDCKISVLRFALPQFMARLLMIEANNCQQSLLCCFMDRRKLHRMQNALLFS